MIPEVEQQSDFYDEGDYLRSRHDVMKAYFFV